MNAPFSGLKVIELATVLAGPAVGMFFAELGAEVLKIENPENKDVTRSWKLPNEKGNVSAYFSAVNYGKKYSALNLKDAADRKTLDALLGDADFLITNFKAGDAEKFNLTYAALKAKFPRLIVGQISGYTSAPQRKAFDVVLQAETGFMFMNGTPDSGPVKMPVALIDILAAHQLKEGLLIALWQREKNGLGALVSASLEESALASLANQASNYLMAGHVPQRMGGAHPNIAPYGDIFTCADQQHIVLAVGSNPHYASLLELLEAPANSILHQLNTNQQRVVQRPVLIDALQQLIQQKNSEDLLATLEHKGIPAGAIKPLNAVFENSAAQNMVLEETIDGEHTKRMSTIAFRISKD